VEAVAYNREDVIWASGLFEGEGSISVAKLPSGKIYPRIKVKMCDEDSVKRFADTFKMIYRPVQKDKTWQDHYKDAWYTDVTGKKAVAVLYMMFPWLCSRRQQRATDVISLWKNNNARILV